MPRFGWMRLAYLLLILTVLTALARVGDPEARSLAAQRSDPPRAPSGARETTGVAPLTEDVTSALEDLRGSRKAPKVGPNIAEPRLPAAPDGVGRGRTAGEQAPAGEGPKTPATAPVFYRPPDPGAPPDAGPVCGDLGGVPKGGRIVFPLQKRFYYSYDDTWGAPRTQGGHEGTDLMTPSGVPEYAITDGTVVPVAGSDPDGWNSLGGYAVMVRADYSIGPVRQGDLFYYAHLQRESALPIGARVQAGQVVGYAGDTGQGPPGTRGLFPPHLHLGWYDASGTREEADSGAMNPYPLLEWVKANGGAVTDDSDARYCEAQRPGPPIPSGTGDWPTPATPGTTPDLDTGSNDPSPAQRGAREVGPKPDPAAKKAARPPKPPEEKPDRQSRPERRPPENSEDAPAKPQDANRPDATRPPKPARPPANHNEPERPVPDQTEPDPPGAPGQSPSDPGPSQYDPATGELGGAREAPSSKPEREPEATPKPPTNSDTGSSREPTTEGKPSDVITDRHP